MSTFILGGLMAFFVLTGAAGHASAPDFPTYSVAMTGYNAVAAQTDGDPFTTASGSISNPDVVAARSRDLAEALPFGTVIAIEPTNERSDTCGLNVVGPSIGYRVIADTMSARMHTKIDILFSESDTMTIGGKTVNASRALGSCENVTIRVVGKIDITHPSQLPKTQAALARIIGASGLALK